MQLTARISHHLTPHSRTNIDKTCQLTGTVYGLARTPHFSLAIIRNSSTLDIGVLGYIGIHHHTEHPLEVWHIHPGTPVYGR
jgi:hypothetical protein